MPLRRFVEASFVPGALFLLSKWYKRGKALDFTEFTPADKDCSDELGVRVAILFCATYASNAFGGQYVFPGCHNTLLSLRYHKPSLRPVSSTRWREPSDKPLGGESHISLAVGLRIRVTQMALFYRRGDNHCYRLARFVAHKSLLNRTDVKCRVLHPAGLPWHLWEVALSRRESSGNRAPGRRRWDGTN